MFKHDIQITFRNLKKQKIFSILSVSSLALGLAVFMLGLLYVRFILNFDTFHRDADRIYGIVQVHYSSHTGEKQSAVLPAPLLSALVQEIPVIEDATRFYRPGRMIVQHQEKRFFEDNVLYADGNFLTFFTFGMIDGNPNTVLSEPYSTVLTKTAAFKYFGDVNPIGRIITLDREIDVRVTGVAEDAPSNSSIRFDFLVSMETVRATQDWMDDWSVNRHAAFVKLPEGYDPIQIESKFPKFIKKTFAEIPDSPTRLTLFPFLDFHLNSKNITSYLAWNPPGELYSSLFGAGLFLLIVCLNFVSLSTSHALNRAKEVGVRKVVGADRLRLVQQFLCESMIQCFIAIPLAVIFFEWICPAFLSFFGNPYDISLWNSPFPLLFFIGVTLVVGMISSIYPAFLLSSFKPVRVLKGDITPRGKGSLARKILVVLQFMLSIILIVGTILLRKQFHFLMDLDLGYDKENIVVLPISDDVRPKFKLLKDVFLQNPEITHVSAAARLPFQWESEVQAIPEDMHTREAWMMNGYAVDYDFVETLGIQIVEGRSFNPQFMDDDNFIINETAVHQFKWNDLVGKRLIVDNIEGTVIGTARDFHFRKLFNPIAPAVLYIGTDDLNIMVVKLSSRPNPDIMSFMEKQWHILVPDDPFEYTLLDHSFKDAYGDISKSATIGIYVGAVAVMLSCLGLFALAAHSLTMRTKEIGIRKVLGATGTKIFKMLNREFLFLVLISNFMGLPLAYWIMQSILQSGYAYQTHIDVTVFVIPSILTLITAVLAIFYQTLKTARTHPVDSLKYE